MLQTLIWPLGRPPLIYVSSILNFPSSTKLDLLLLHNCYTSSKFLVEMLCYKSIILHYSSICTVYIWSCMMLSPCHIICPHHLCNFVPSSCSPYTFFSSDIPLQTPIPKHLRLILIIIVAVIKSWGSWTQMKLWTTERVETSWAWILISYSWGKMRTLNHFLRMPKMCLITLQCRSWAWHRLNNSFASFDCILALPHSLRWYLTPQ